MLLDDILLGVLFFVIAHPHTFKVTNALLRPLIGSLCSSEGCPNARGLVVHAVVFVLLARFLCV